MNAAPLDIGQRRFTVDRVAEHIEHSRQNFFTDRSLQWAASVNDCHASREPLRGRQRDPTHMTRISLRQYFDDDAI